MMTVKQEMIMTFGRELVDEFRECFFERLLDDQKSEPSELADELAEEFGFHDAELATTFLMEELDDEIERSKLTKGDVMGV